MCFYSLSEFFKYTQCYVMTESHMYSYNSTSESLLAKSRLHVLVKEFGND